MQESKIELRSRIGRIAAAAGFALVIGSFAVGPAHADNNWRVVPEAALHTLEREALSGAQTVTQQ